MKVVILAGGLGSRLSEETELRPKPMIEIGNKPILWHIMKIYSFYGFNEFIVLLGYKGYMIKEYFVNYYLYQSDLTVNLSSNKINIHKNSSEPWEITLVDTGIDTMTGGRIKRIRNLLGKNSFMLTYGDGLADINIKDLLDFHNRNKKIATMTSIQPEGRFGSLSIKNNIEVKSFVEKPPGDKLWINGGFLVCEPEVFDYINDDSTIFEEDSLKLLAKEGQLYAFKHRGFWKCMDTQRDKIQLNKMWENGEAKWKIWKD